MALRLPAAAVFQPIGDTLYCQMFMQTERWREDSVLIIPDIAKEEVFIAKVLSVGPGKIIEYDTRQETPANERAMRMPVQVAPGDVIVFARYHGERLEIDGAYYLILREDDVLGKIIVPEEKIAGYLRPWKIGQNDDALVAAKIMAPA